MLGRLSPKRLFLIDGIGAMLTAFLLSQVLARYEATFGMPRKNLYILAGIAACFAAYSLFCHLLITHHARPFLKGIAIANTLYCMTTLSWVGYLYASLTEWGIAYFIGEILIVMALVRIEWSVAHKEPH